MVFCLIFLAENRAEIKKNIILLAGDENHHKDSSCFFVRVSDNISEEAENRKL